MPHLPDELWLHILAYVEPKDIWTSLRPVNKQLAACSEDYMTRSDSILSRFTIGLQFSLGSGSHHRWYDIRGTITFSFRELNKHNPQYALFGSCLVHPQKFYARALEHWKRMSDNGMGGRQEWRVQYGYDSEVRSVRLPKIVVADDEGVFCDWREMFDAYFAQPAEEARHLAWSSREN